MSTKPLTNEEKDYIKENYLNTKYKDIANKLGRSVSVVAAFVCKNLEPKLKTQEVKCGDKFNRYTIKEIYINNKTSKNDKWAKCECECGTIKDIKLVYVTNGYRKSCGCLKNEKASERMTKQNFVHGLCGKENKQIYQCWCGMKDRCNNPNDESAKNYHFRGINVCDEWQNSFENFYNWANQSGYRPGLTIERINNDGNYEPSNCRWATLQEQARNKQDTIYVEYNGKKIKLIDLCEKLNLDDGLMRYRLKNKWTLKEAISTSTRQLFKAFGEEKTHLEWAKDIRCVVSETTLSSRLYGLKWDAEKAITQPVSKGKTFTAFGETKMVKEWLKDPRCKANKSTLIARLEHYNWEPENAISTPSRKYSS